MAQREESSVYCKDCRGLKNFGKYNCKKCSNFYTSEFKSCLPTYDQLQRRKRKDSPEELKKIYDWLRINIFPEGYVLPGNRIIFSYKRNGSNGAWCNKRKKEIRFSPLNYSKDYMYKTMLHEMIHLRIPNHRKRFRKKEKELLAVLKKKELPED